MPGFPCQQLLRRTLVLVMSFHFCGSSAVCPDTAPSLLRYPFVDFVYGP